MLIVLKYVRVLFLSPVVMDVYTCFPRKWVISRND